MESFNPKNVFESANAKYYKYKNVNLDKYRATHQVLDLADLELELHSLEQHLAEVIKVQPESMTIAGELHGGYLVEDDSDSTFDEYTELELEIAMSNAAKEIIKELIGSKNLQRAA